MAVLEELKGIEVQIRSAGAPLQEYTDRFAEPGPNNPLADVTVVRYVEAVSDERFSVLLSVLPAYISGGHALVFTLSIDGDQIRMTTDGDLKKNHGGWCWEERGFYGKINGTAMLRHFKFSKIDMVEDDSPERVLKDKETVAGVGEIIVEVRPCIYMGETGHWPGQMPSKEKVGVIAEKAAKGQALSHSVELEKSVISKTKFSYADIKPLYNHDRPIAVFVFRYRSRKVLQDLLMLPKDLGPDVLEKLSQDEIEKLARLYFESQLDLAPIRKIEDEKRKFTDDDEDLTIDITGNEEVETRIAKKPRTFVDLSDDSESRSSDSEGEDCYFEERGA